MNLQELDLQIKKDYLEILYSKLDPTDLVQNGRYSEIEANIKKYNLSGEGVERILNHTSKLRDLCD